VCAVLVAHHRPTVVLQAHLPEHRVAGETRVVAAAGNVRLDSIALRSRPVLVVAGADDERVPAQRRRVVGEIARNCVVQFDVRSLSPLDEATFVGVPASRTHVARIAMLVAEALIHRAIDIGLLAEEHRWALAIVAFGVRSHQHAAPKWAIERDPMTAGVKTAPTPVVVRVVGVSGDHEQRRASAGRFRCAQNERGMPDGAIVRCAMSAQRDQVHAAAPIGTDRNVDRIRPAAAI